MSGGKVGGQGKCKLLFDYSLDLEKDTDRPSLPLLHHVHLSGQTPSEPPVVDKLETFSNLVLHCVEHDITLV